jgi:hypothetical protein
MECNIARILLPFASTPTELSADDREQLEEHLAHCPTCGEIARRERIFHTKVGRAMLAVSVPHSLRGQIHTRLAIERGHALRKQVLKFAAAAAIVLLTALVGWSWWSNKQTWIQPDEIAAWQDEQVSATPQMVQAFFRSRHERMEFPPGFDPNLLRDREIVEIHGHAVPRLIFQRGDGMAKVYVLEKSHFKVDKDALRQPAIASKCTVEVIEDRDYLFVIVYIGEVNRQNFQNANQIVG